MDTKPQFQITLSRELIQRLRRQAQAQRVPLRWLVAGLVCDTLEADHSSETTLRSRRVPVKLTPGQAPRGVEFRSAL